MTLKQRLASVAPDDLALVDAAFAFADLAHQGQRRDSGEPYIEHPVAVATILADLGLDPVTIAAALLHDTVEDTGVTLAQIEAQFGKEIAGLVDGVTKLGRLEWRTQVENQVENLRKMLLAMARDIRVLLIKLADRLHNMRTLRHRPPDKQREVARETIEVYAPLAHRLGMFSIKWELEDLSFRYLEPEKYRELSELITLKRAEREALIDQVCAVLRERLHSVGVRAEVHGRAKHFYSIYKKMKLGRDLSEIYDLMAVRVIVDTVKDCYSVLGIVHSLWKPIPGRFKDYISVPKPNMYQSLHTTVIGPRGETFEIQIRTWEMHRTAEYGIAAHWKYKEGRTDRQFDDKLAWLRSVLEWQNDLRDAREIIETMKTDLFADQVFVFTPKGDVVDLPAGATPVDFAYQIHTDVGHRCVGAKVNGKIVPLDTPLKTGDIVEILTSKTPQGPGSDWLNIVKTSQAKAKIRQWFKREKRDENLARGRELVQRELEKHGLGLDRIEPAWMEETRKRLSAANEEDLLISVGYGGITAQQVVARLLIEFERARKAAEPVDLGQMVDARKTLGYGKAVHGVQVRGVDNVLIRFARCCNPVPGDPIIGYVTRGRGVSVHRLDCPNATDFMAEPARLIEVAWADTQGASFPVELQIHALSRVGLLADVAGTVAETRTNILSASARDRKDRMAVVDLVLEIKNLEQLQYLVQKLAKIRDVMSVQRVVREDAR